PRHGSPAGGRGWVRRLLPFMRLRPANILLALGTMAAGGVVGSVLPLVQRQLLDRALAGRVGALWAPLGLLFGIGAFAYVLQRVAGYRELKAANDLQDRLYH